MSAIARILDLSGVSPSSDDVAHVQHFGHSELYLGPVELHLLLVNSLRDLVQNLVMLCHSLTSNDHVIGDDLYARNVTEGFLVSLMHNFTGSLSAERHVAEFHPEMHQWFMIMHAYMGAPGRG